MRQPPIHSGFEFKVKIFVKRILKKQKIKKLQAVQNFAARIISGTSKFYHITPVLKQLQ